jgi:hypothetical protein
MQAKARPVTVGITDDDAIDTRLGMAYGTEGHEVRIPDRGLVVRGVVDAKPADDGTNGARPRERSGRQPRRRCDSE